MSYQPETPILAQGPKAWGLKWVEDWYGTWYEKCHNIRDRPFNLQGGEGGWGCYGFLFRLEIFFRTARESEYFLFLWCEARNFCSEFNIRLPYQSSTHLSPQAFGPWANMGVSGWYDMYYEKCHIIIYKYYSRLYHSL
jgi:hypothetical protein